MTRETSVCEVRWTPWCEAPALFDEHEARSTAAYVFEFGNEREDGGMLVVRKLMHVCLRHLREWNARGYPPPRNPKAKARAALKKEGLETSPRVSIPSDLRCRYCYASSEATDLYMVLKDGAVERFCLPCYERHLDDKRAAQRRAAEPPPDGVYSDFGVLK